MVSETPLFFCHGECAGWYPECAFRKNHARHICLASRRHPVCKLCDQTKRDEKKKANRWLDKARSCTDRHADRYIKKGLVRNRIEFREKFGWNIEKLAHDFEHAYDNSCQCGEKYKEMGHGLKDITLDIHDRSQLPYYTNTRLMCSTCNTTKGNTPPNEWGATLVYQRQWKMQIQKARADSWGTLPLGTWLKKQD